MFVLYVHESSFDCFTKLNVYMIGLIFVTCIFVYIHTRNHVELCVALCTLCLFHLLKYVYTVVTIHFTNQKMCQANRLKSTNDLFRHSEQG